MIFIFNTTGKQLILKSAEKKDRVVLNLVIPELEVTHPLCHVPNEHKELADKMLASYKEGVAIKGDLAKRTLAIDGTVCFYAYETNQLYNVDMHEEFCRDLYKSSPRNMMVVVTSKDGTIDYNEKNVIGQTRYTFRQELSVHQFYLKWNDWSKLKFPIEISVWDGNKKTVLQTSYITDTNKAGREFHRNMLKRTVSKTETEQPVKKTEPKTEKKPYNGKPKYDKGNTQNKSKFVRSSGDKYGKIIGGSRNDGRAKTDGYSKTRPSGKSAGRPNNKKHR